MEGMELICFQIISVAGTAKSLYMESIYEARVANYERARSLILQGKEIFVEAHKHHANLIQQEANKQKVEIGLLLLHAEDQLMSAETIGALAEEFVYLYERLGI